MQTVNPWIAVVVIVVGVGAAIGFALLHIPEASIPSGIVAVGVTILLGGAHAQTTGQLKTLRASMRPPPALDDDPPTKP
jgi:hypothetical protein